MNRNLITLNALLLASLAAAPTTFAQSSGEGEGEGPMVGKTDDELEKDFVKLSGEVSKGMSSLENEIARASLPPRKAAELEAELRAALAKLKAGEAAQHEGLEAWLKENPEKLATLLGVTREEAEKLAGNTEALTKKLSEHADGVSKLMEEADFVQTVLRRQLQIELSIREKMEKQAQLAKETSNKLEEIINIAYEMRARQPQKKGSGKPEDEQSG
jgi:predicted RNase H-like nuclease (RuvC/YqgF family)